MATLSRDDLTTLVTKAALDSKFRADLKADPRRVVQRPIPLDDDDLASLATLSDDLERFVKEPLHPIDAKSWAIGICHIHAE